MVSSLYVIKGKDQGSRFDLVDSVLHLGRDRSNRIQLHDTEVSRRHAELRLQDSFYVVSDMGSSNGTYVNNEPVDRHVLRTGDRLQIGRTVMLFTGGSEESSHVLASDVDIVNPDAAFEGSRIVTSYSQAEGSKILAVQEGTESPWLARARSNLQVMYRTALAVSHTLDIDQLLHRIMELIFEWVEADRGCVMLVDQESDQLTPKATRNRQGVDHTQNIEISRTILDYVMERKEGVVTSDARDDARWEAGRSIVKLGVREAICVPMQGRYGIVGVIYIDTYTPPGRVIQQGAIRRFTDDHLKLMIAIGHQAALAVEDTSYYSAMVQAERLAAMGQTIATLSHHVKNILQGIRGGSYLIDEGLKSNDTGVVRRGWAIVEKNQDKISNLVMDMLTFSKEREPDMQPADINDVIGDVVELMQVRANDCNVELIWEPSNDIPELTFDPEALHRAILNVVTNAIDASEQNEQGRVTLDCQLDEAAKKLTVTVEDNGGGISPDDQARIFSVFESTKGARGTGLGLPVSQKILREHSGDIRIESELGKGSRFILRLPAIIPDPVRETATDYHRVQ